MEKKNKKIAPVRSAKFLNVASKDTPFAYTEAFKDLRTNLGFLSNVNGVKSVLITSALPEESKSTTAINLAITLASGGKSVVLVECDLRKPVLRKYLKRELGKAGLSAYLAGVADLEDCIVDLPDLNISVIGAGVVPPNPSELLNTERMHALIETLKLNFDYVLLDAPPVNLVTDAAVVGRMADGAILIVRSRFAAARTVRQAKARLEAVGVRILGGILTRFDAKKSGWAYGYDYKGYEYGYGQPRRKK